MSVVVSSRRVVKCYPVYVSWSVITSAIRLAPYGDDTGRLSAVFALCTAKILCPVSVGIGVLAGVEGSAEIPVVAIPTPSVEQVNFISRNWAVLPLSSGR